MNDFSNNSNHPQIFVQIISYRDTECQFTVQDLFNKAAHPDRINVGICWQFIPGVDDDCFQVETRPEQVRTIKLHASESKGATWARNQVQSLWEGEQYTLQIDSHMRFAQDWDVRMLEQLSQCASDKPILSAYPPSYTPPRHLKNALPSTIVAHQFTPKGILLMRASSTPWENGTFQTKPVPSFFCSGCYIFASSQIINDAPYDPHLFFFGEEITLTVRLWTQGWDIFAPNAVLIWHDWNRTRRPTIQNDQQQKSGQLQQRAVQRVKHIFGMELSNDAQVIQELDIYGLGAVRTLEEYEKRSGVNFKLRQIGNLAPKPKPCIFNAV